MDEIKWPSWEEYFMEIAYVVSKRSTCLRRKVGAIAVKDRQILATGYNGAPAHVAHCSQVGCVRSEPKVPPGERHEPGRGIHAEQNVIIQAAVNGISIKGAVGYCTHHPCIVCAKMLINAGIDRVVYGGEYPDRMAALLFEEAEIEVVRSEYSIVEQKNESIS